MPEPNDPIQPDQEEKKTGVDSTDPNPVKRTNEFINNDTTRLDEATLNEEDKEKDTKEEDFEPFDVDKVDKLQQEKKDDTK